MRPLRDISQPRPREAVRKRGGGSGLPKARGTAAGGYPYI